MYPVTIVDNFLPDPDKIVQLSTQYSYYKDVNGNWPGERTECLSQLNADLYNYLGEKIHKLFYENLPRWQMEISFQKTVPFASDIEASKSIFNRGWIHDDYSSLFGGIIYLNKNPDEDTGTSIYKIKNGYFSHAFESMKIKGSFYRGEQVDAQEYEKHWNIVNSQYEETVTVKNVYNRMMMFGSHVHHGVQTFGYSQPRLTLAFFARNMSGSIAPLIRSSV